MTVRKIVDIEIPDEKVKRYLELVNQVNGQLAKMPAEWRVSADAAAEVTKEFDAMTAGLVAQAELIRENAVEQKHADDAKKQAAKEANEVAKERAKIERERQKSEEDHQKKVAQFWRDSATLTGNIARNAASITYDIAKFAVKGTALGLIGGGVGLFGLDALAGAVSGQRKAAQGLGVTSGENQAFQTNFGSRLVGEDFLSGVQGVSSDISKQWQFGQLGIPEAEVRSNDTATLGIDVIKRAKELWDQAGAAGHNQQWMGAHGLDGFMDFATWQRIGAASTKDIEGYADQYQHDKRSMGASDPVQKDWQDFSVQMERAGKQIEAVFVKGLDPLIPGLTKLSAAVEHALAGLLGNPHIKEGIDDIAKGISTFGDYLGSEKFSTDVRGFVDQTAAIAESMKRFVPDLATLGTAIGDAAHVISRVLGPLINGTPFNHDMALQWNALHPGAEVPVPPKEPNPVTWWNPGSWFQGQDNTPPQSLLDAIEQVESGGNPRAVSPVGAKGAFQFMDSTWREYGQGRDVFDPAASRDAAKRYLGDLGDKYGGNVAEELAAYNWGAGNDKDPRLDADIAAHGRDWLKYAPRETQNYVENIAHRIHVEVHVLNQTGAQIAVIANGVRQ